MEAKKAGRMLPLDSAAPQVPRPVVKLVHSLLSPEPAHRFSSAAALATRLKSLYYDALHGDPGGAAQDLSGLEDEPGAADAPFVGRFAELVAVRSAVGAVAGGKAGALAIVGEAGIGKSRLISEALSGTQGLSMLVGYGRCRQLGELVPYSPLREALGALASLLEALQPNVPELHRQAGEALLGQGEALLRLVPELAHLLPQGDDDEASESEGSTVQGMGAELVARALAHFLSRLAALRPLTLVIEDLHWSDAGTRAVLRRLTGPLAPKGVLFLITTRSADALPESPRLEALFLDSLMPEESGHLLASLVGGAPRGVVAALMEAVPVLATGNPLAAAQIVRDLVAEGYLTRDGDGEVALSPHIREQYRPPESISAVFERALERVPPGALQILRVAARIDRHFRASDLTALGLFQAPDVQRALETAVRERLVVGGGDRYSFVHDTLREKLAASTTGHLQDVHRRIAHQLEERGASAGMLGYHLEQAGDQLAAAQAFLRAGLEADELSDPSGASIHLQRAYSLLAEMPQSPARDDALVRALHELVRVACLFGAAGDTFTVLEEGNKLIAVKTPAQQLAIDSAYARMYFAQADFPRAAEYSARCLQTSASDPALRRYHYIPSSVIGRAMAASGKFGPALPVLTEAYDLAREANEPVEESHTEGVMAMALGFTGELDQARTHARSALFVARRMRNAERIAAGYYYDAAIAEAQGRWEEGVQRTAQLLAYAEEKGITGLYLCLGTLYAGRHQFHLGRLDRARLLLGSAMNLCKQSGTQFGLPEAHAFLGDVELVAQRHGEARAAYAEGLRMANAGATDEYAAPLCLIGLAHLTALEGGSADEVRRLADESVARFADMSNVTALAVAHQRYAEALDALGDRAGAEQWREKWQAHAGRPDIGECDFWPRPDGDARAPTRREYWKDAPARAALRPALAEEPAAETLTPQPRPRAPAKLRP
jgi:tetratricopeptide (TPR) repeat protein